MTHICISKLTIIGSDNSLSPGRRQTIIWTRAGRLLIGPLGTNFREMLIEIDTFSFNKMHLKMLFEKWRPFCLGLNVLKHMPWDMDTVLLCFVLLCFVLLCLYSMLTEPWMACMEFYVPEIPLNLDMGLCDLFTHIFQGCFIDTKGNVRFPNAISSKICILNSFSTKPQSKAQ